MHPKSSASLAKGPEGRHLRLLQAGWVTSAFDRFVIGPMLLSIAADFDVSLEATVAAASFYFLCYGLSQPLWGACLDRLGRVRTMRITLAAAAVAGMVSAAAPTISVLVVARACTGAFIGAVVPAGMVYVGDMVPFDRRQAALTDLNAALAGGIAIAIALGGVLAATVSWRVAFLVPAVGAGALATLLGGLPEPSRRETLPHGLLSLFRSRWSFIILFFALVEGAALLGCLTYFAPALESGGTSPSVAGGIVGLYGVGLLVASLVVKRLAMRLTPAVFLTVGALGLTVAFMVAALAQTTLAIGAAALLLGASWAPMNSTMQAWATDVVAGARATMVSMFVTMVFIGGGLGTAALAPLAASSRWTALFLVGVALAVVFGAGAPAARSMYGASRSTG